VRANPAAFTPLPVAVLTGFLGAGKTTLLNRLLKEPGLDGTAVVVNEFGEVGIDHLLVERATEGVIELSGGCLCCAVRGELSNTLVGLVDEAARGTRALKRVVVETSGLADPSAILSALIGHPVLAEHCRLDGVLTLVDAVHCVEALAGHWEARAQAAVADRILLTKIDLATPEHAAAAEARVRALNGRAEILRDLPASLGQLLSAALIDPSTRQADLRRWLGEHEHHDHGSHGHDHGFHRHGHHGRGPAVRSFALTADSPLPFSAVEGFLDLLLSLHGERLLRLKGVVALQELPETPFVLHGVRKLLHPPARLPAWPASWGDAPRGARLVLIGRDLDEAIIRRLWDGMTGRPGIDAPDRAALEANPLSIRGFGG
jgi:G3E family GTPase